MHNVEVFVNYDPPCNSVSTARRLNKRSSSSIFHFRYLDRLNNTFSGFEGVKQD